MVYRSKSALIGVLARHEQTGRNGGFRFWEKWLAGLSWGTDFATARRGWMWGPPFRG